MNWMVVIRMVVMVEIEETRMVETVYKIVVPNSLGLICESLLKHILLVEINFVRIELLRTIWR